MRYTLEQGQRYRAELELEGFEAWASNSMIREKLEDYGFVEVVVTGDSSHRVAYATWIQEGITGDIPSQISDIREIDYGLRELNTRDDGW